jgi:head-tail adaptor
MIRSLPAYWFNVTGSTQRAIPSVDSGGGPVSTWATNIASLPMRFNVPSGALDIEHTRFNSELIVKIFVNGNPVPDITDKDRIIYGSRVFDIKAIRNVDESGVFLTIDAVEVLPSAVVL